MATLPLPARPFSVVRPAARQLDARSFPDTRTSGPRLVPRRVLPPTPIPTGVLASVLSPAPKPGDRPARARLCARPDCCEPATASMSYDYGTRTVYMGDLGAQRDPSVYDLCGPHVLSLKVPVGWSCEREWHVADDEALDTSAPTSRG